MGVNIQGESESRFPVHTGLLEGRCYKSIGKKSDCCPDLVILVPSEVEERSARKSFPVRLKAMWKMKIKRRDFALHRISWMIALLLVQWGMVSCAAPLDMSTKRGAAPDENWGIVIGSFLVVPETGASETQAGHDASEMLYVFDIIQLRSGDADGNYFTMPKYRLAVKPGEERIFVSRLRPGSYLIRDFHEEGIVGLEGEVGSVFTVQSKKTHYIGRLRVVLPGRTAKGKMFRFAVENDRESTLTEVSKVYPDLANTAVNVPMQISVPTSP